MSNKSTQAKLNQQNGELSIQQHETDSPILPIAQLQQLHEFKPEAVDWVITQTQIEAEFRRTQNAKINKYVFIERLIGQICALLIGLAGVIGGSYVAVNGQPTAGGTIATVALTGLAVVFLTGRKKNN